MGVIKVKISSLLEAGAKKTIEKIESSGSEKEPVEGMESFLVSKEKEEKNYILIGEINFLKKKYYIHQKE